jgi:hypothetical protein
MTIPAYTRVHMDSPPTNAQRFMALYVAELEAAMTRKPENFALRAGESVQDAAYERADKMVTAMIRGNDVNVSDAMRRTAKRLMIGTTREAIFKYIRT